LVRTAQAQEGDEEKTPAEDFERLGKFEAEGNRFTLARVPLKASSEPVAAHGGLTAARLQGDATGNLLTDALKKDRHMGRFVPRVLPDGSVEAFQARTIASMSRGSPSQAIAWSSTCADRCFADGP